METTDVNIVQAVYTYGNDLISMHRADANPYYHYDGLGTVKQMTNDSGAIVANYVYDSFGNSVASVSSVANSYGFTGEQQLNEADNMVFLRARYYKPDIGRFMSRDPIGYEDSINLYVYVKNNSVNLTDPTGEISGCAACIACIGGSVAICYYKCDKDSCKKGSTWDCANDCMHRFWYSWDGDWKKKIARVGCWAACVTCGPGKAIPGAREIIRRIFPL